MERRERASVMVPADVRDRLRDLARQVDLPMTTLIKMWIARAEREGVL